MIIGYATRDLVLVIVTTKTTLIDCFPSNKKYCVSTINLTYKHEKKKLVTQCIIAILHIQNSIILIQITEHNNFMLEWEQTHSDITLTKPVHLIYFLYHMRLYKYFMTPK